MPDAPRKINWEWEEIVLACDLVAQNGWRQLDEDNPQVKELSGILQRMSLHPLESRLSNFRNPAGVALKTYNIATVHPDYLGPPSNGSKLDKEVLEAFLGERDKMHRDAMTLRRVAESGEPVSASLLFGDEDESVMEGRYLLRLHKVWERKPALRKKKIRSVQAKGLPLQCEACGFNFAETYGDRGQGFIECHHVEPLHEVGERRNTINDLALLCSNCHRMTHRKPPWPTPAQLRAIMQGQSSPQS